jgi:alginate O-acetyltransferase complex protein AlgI
MRLGFLFIAFLAGSLIIYWTLPNQKSRTVFLGLASLIFILLADKLAGRIVVILTIYTYFFSVLIEHSKYKSFYHKVSVAGIITFLVFFKYMGFLDKYIHSVTHFFMQNPAQPFEKILIPLGLSYITFRYISYLTDIYWGINKKTDIYTLLFYGGLFTTFLSGPIDRYERIEKQINVFRINYTKDFVYDGFERITFGLFKKFVIADWIGYLINNISTNPDGNSFGIKAIVLFGFSIQLYLDFAGYSDIAIGTSRLFGLKIMENFNSPYTKPNISQFWRNWHISLSDWIRDYIFFPMSKISDNKIWLLVFVPVISMGLCGMWHGSEMKFALWGMYHGAGLSFFQFWSGWKRKNKSLKKFTDTPAFNFIAVIITFVFVTIGWLFFR